MAGAGERLVGLGLATMAGVVVLGWAGLKAWQHSEDRAREVAAENSVADARAAASADRTDRERREVTRQQRQRAMASEAWRTLDRAPCQTPTTPAACGNVEGFVTTYPDDPHAPEARALVAAAQPALDGLRDDAAWSAVDVAPCKAPRASRDCDAVQTYLNGHPTGHHVDDARRLLASSAAAIAALERQEQAKADAADQATRTRFAAELKERLAAREVERAREKRLELPPSMSRGRVRCCDGSLSFTCTLEPESFRTCCAAHGGVC